MFAFYKISISPKVFRETLKFYSNRPLRRKAIRVLNVPETPITPIKTESYSPKRTNDENSSCQVSPFLQKEILVPRYEKLQKVDSRFTKTIGIIKSRNLREKSGKILLEGKRLINDAINAGVKLQTIYFSREKDLADIKFKTIENVEIFKVLYNTMKVWSDLTTCPGIMGIFKRPSVEDIQILSSPVLPVNIVCDNIRDPGNLGSIIRNAAAAGCQNIFLLKGCVDPYETKVLKTACGGHFRIPVVNNIEWSHLSNYIAKEANLFIADNTADINEWSHDEEYINYEEEETDENDEPKKYFTKNEEEQVIEVDETYNEPSELEPYETLSLPCHLYSSVKYPKKDIVIYVGGETHGVDPRITKFACNHTGKKIKIPLENCMDSLNSSFALTIILYEIKRQLGERYVTAT